MADKKISQLTDGTSFQAGDEAVVNRGGVNYKVDPTQFGSSIDVTGTVTADGLTVEGASTVSTFPNSDFTIDIKNNGALQTYFGTDYYILSAKVATIQARYAGFLGNPTGSLHFGTRANNSADIFQRMSITQSGDISFYEDTGTTPKFFWDASAESLGIGAGDINLSGVGTGGTNTVVTVQGNNQFRGILELANSTGVSSVNSSAGDVSWFDNDNKIAQVSALGQDLTNHDDGDLAFYTASGGTLTEVMRIDSSGNVGIGTSSPNAKVEIVNTSAGAVATQLFLHNASDIDGTGARLDFAGLATGTIPTGSISNIRTGAGAYALTFNNYGGGSNAERMRIDSSGNLLVGTTSFPSGTNTGVSIQGDGLVYGSRNGSTGGAAGIFNRTASDGVIAEFRKDGSTVGSIGSRAGVVSTLVLNPASGNGAGLSGGTKCVVPADEAGIIDNDISLGISGYRFKDLYLSGGVYLGGTAAANLLDDYEEGTFTPGFSFGGGSTGITYSAQSGAYTKIGRMVYCQVYVALTNNGTDTGTALLTGLPFTVGDVVSNTSLESGGLMTFFNFAGANVSGFTLHATQATTTASIFALPASGTAASAATDTDIANTFNCRLFLTYSV